MNHKLAINLVTEFFNQLETYDTVSEFMTLRDQWVSNNIIESHKKFISGLIFDIWYEENKIKYFEL